MARTGATVADACAEYLRYVEQDLQRKPSTVRDYLPHLGRIHLETSRVTALSVGRSRDRPEPPDGEPHSRETITVFHGAMERARKLYRLPINPVVDVEKPRTASNRTSGSGTTTSSSSASPQLPRGSALSKRYRAVLERAARRRLRFHDLRHTFGTRVIGVADIRRVQEWMGHATVLTTMQYLHYVPRPQDAALVGGAFAIDVGAEWKPVGFDEDGQGRLL
jgi:hypothetical protein